MTETLIRRGLVIRVLLMARNDQYCHLGNWQFYNAFTDFEMVSYNLKVGGITLNAQNDSQLLQIFT